MAVVDIFSKRQGRAKSDVDVYFYDSLPEPLRIQIIHIIRDAFGRDRGHSVVEKAFKSISDTLCREYGVLQLAERQQSYADEIFSFFMKEESVERTLDVVEQCFRFIVSIEKNEAYQYYVTQNISSDDALEELNTRFKEHSIGYQFLSDQIIRIDSNFLHLEAVKPALGVLQGSEFQGANEEFLQAHEHYRHGRYQESLMYSLKAFESTMKCICKLRGWTINQNDTAKKLIAVCLDHDLVPRCLESQLSALRSLLESGVPTIRNKYAGHGQGPEPIDIPEYLSHYALNLTATSILFLVEAHFKGE